MFNIVIINIHKRVYEYFPKMINPPCDVWLGPWITVVSRYLLNLIGERVN
jgi:hypothetical protein